MQIQIIGDSTLLAFEANSTCLVRMVDAYEGPEVRVTVSGIDEVAVFQLPSGPGRKEWARRVYQWLATRIFFGGDRQRVKILRLIPHKEEEIEVKETEVPLPQSPLKEAGARKADGHGSGEAATP